MATVQHQVNGFEVPKFHGTVKACEDWIGGQEFHDPAGVHRGDYTIDMTEAEEAAYQKGETS